FKLAMDSQPTWPLLYENWILYFGYGLIILGSTLVFSSYFALGFYGTFLGDYFGILMEEKVTGFPFSVLDNPMYWGSTCNFLGSALVKASQAGILLSAVVALCYRIAISFEGLFDEDEMGKIRLNVGGTYFETTSDTLLQRPDTKLGALVKKNKNEGSVDDLNLFFDRSPEIFNFILDIYRTGQLHLPTNICGATIRNELEFWEIPRDQIERCCLQTYYKYDNETEILTEIEETLKATEIPEADGSCTLRKCWLRFLLDPRSSKAAAIFSVVFMFMVILSTITMLLATVSDLRVMDPNFANMKRNMVLQNLSQMSDRKEQTVDDLYTRSRLTEMSQPHPVIRIIDLACLVFFSAECLLRFFLYESKRAFFQGKLNKADLVAIAAGWINFGLDLTRSHWQDNHYVFILTRILSLMRILRIFRFFKFFLKFAAFRVILLTLSSSFKQLCMTLVFSTLALVFFAITTFYAELEGKDEGTGNEITNAFEAIWWALVTMTTVGYGDFTPKTPAGRCFGSIAAVSGILILAMPIAIVTSNFTSYHMRTMDIMTHTSSHAPRTPVNCPPKCKKSIASFDSVKIRPSWFEKK
ncbi:hypothetical protein FSP39_022180, partial [Pinctada imbricata]